MSNQVEYDLSCTELNHETSTFRHRNKSVVRKSPGKYFPVQKQNLINTGWVKRGPSITTKEMDLVKQQVGQLITAYEELRYLVQRLQIHQNATTSLQVATANLVRDQLTEQAVATNALCELSKRICHHIPFGPINDIEPVSLPGGALSDPIGCINQDLRKYGEEPMKALDLSEFQLEHEDFTQFLKQDFQDENMTELAKQLECIYQNEETLLTP